MIELSLQADLGIEHVAALHDALLPHLDDEATVTLAGNRVERVHCAGLQVLHAFVRDRAARGQSTRITLPSPALANAARMLALSASLGLEPNGDTHA